MGFRGGIPGFNFLTNLLDPAANLNKTLTKMDKVYRDAKDVGTKIEQKWQYIPQWSQNVVCTFSVAVSKKRSRLLDSSIDGLVFLLFSLLQTTKKCLK